MGSVGSQVFAAEEQATVNARTAPVETYTYDMPLDVKRVIAITEAGDQCGAVPVQMTYEDSHGQRHVLQYQVLGTGCSNG